MMARDVQVIDKKERRYQLFLFVLVLLGAHFLSELFPSIIFGIRPNQFSIVGFAMKVIFMASAGQLLYRYLQRRKARRLAPEDEVT